ncbi:MAG: hypothetical protein M0Q53_02270 [Prolixibacteraceae bacterium]|jgi:hypothetical protein|nr:hypothetical protein [Prolixibacteraceae bacterium]
MKNFRRLLKIIKNLFLTLIGLLLIGLLVVFAKPMWRHWVTYPNNQKQVEAFALRKKECPDVTGLKIYRGVMHLHSYWSHDSKGTINDLVDAAKLRNINFIFLTDHPHGNLDSFPRGYSRGLYDGVLLEPGSEKQGFDAWPLKDGVVNWNANKDSVSKQIVSNGGIVFYAHTEEPHNWANPWYQGMEIYNFHTNVKLKTSTWPILTDFLINGSKYRAWAYRTIFHRQTGILAHWDSINIQRKIVGFSAVDEHENVNFRARYTKDGRIQLMGIDTKPVGIYKVSFWNKWLLDTPDKDGWIFKWMLVNTYETSFNNSVNYLFADSLNLNNISHHIVEGHHFTAFKFLADATGFCYYGAGPDGSMKGMMGDSIKVADLKQLKAISPYPGRFALIKDGKTLEVTDGETYQYTFDKPLSKGAYRIEVEVKPGDEWQPWIYTNPIYLY